MQSGLTVSLRSVPISQMIRIKEEKMEGVLISGARA